MILTTTEAEELVLEHEAAKLENQWMIAQLRRIAHAAGIEWDETVQLSSLCDQVRLRVRELHRKQH